MVVTKWSNDQPVWIACLYHSELLVIERAVALLVMIADSELLGATLSLRHHRASACRSTQEQKQKFVVPGSPRDKDPRFAAQMGFP